MATALTLEQVLNFLLDTPLFRDLDPAELSQVVHLMQIRPLRESQTLFAEGQPGDAWYVVYDGLLEVEKDGRRVAELGARACVGEMAVLDGSPRSATVRALESSTIFRFSREAFERSLEENNLAAYKLVLQMARTLAARQRDTTARLATWQRDRVHDIEDVVEPIVAQATRAE